MNQKTLFNTGWQFARTKLGVSYEQKAVWQAALEPVALPHDWLIWQTDRPYEDGIGWYVKDWRVQKKEGQRIHLRFDGVYMDSALYVNDGLVGEWKYGYSTFEYDVTDALRDGDNRLVMRVVHQSPNSRWYSGAGIYRNVWLITVPEVHMASDGIYLSVGKAQGGYELRVETELADGQGGAPQLAEEDGRYKYQLRYTLLDGASLEGNEVWQHTVDCRPEDAAIDNQTVLTPDGRRLEHGARFDSRFTVDSPHLWDVDDPICIHCRWSCWRMDRSYRARACGRDSAARNSIPLRDFY